MVAGFIKLHRRFLDWEWYSDINVRILFLHCLLRANHEPSNWQGIDIKPGEFVTSLSHLSKETCLSIKQIRTALEKLQKGKELGIKTTRQNTVVTVNNWDKWQTNGTQKGNRQEEILLRNISKEEEYKNLLSSSSWFELILSWLNYKKENKQAYKSERALRAFINKLLKLSNEDLLKAKAIIEQSMANNWQGIFPLKEEKKVNDRYEPLFLG